MKFEEQRKLYRDYGLILFYSILDCLLFYVFTNRLYGLFSNIEIKSFLSVIVLSAIRTPNVTISLVHF